jgi:GT2 family glycosyltransferase
MKRSDPPSARQETSRGSGMGRRVYILLPVHNRKNITQEFVRCLRGQRYGNYHLVLIDDGSSDGTEAMVRKHITDLTVIRGKGNWWWGGSLHRGYLWLRNRKIDDHDVVLIMNDDTEFETDFLERGLSLLQDYPNTLLLAQCYSRSTGALLDRGVHADWEGLTFVQAEKPEEINCLSTMGLFMEAGNFFKVGGFHPKLLPHFTSDYEFTIRARRKGFNLLTDPSLRLWLREETTWNRDIGQEPFFVFLRLLFSKRSAYNPITWIFFIALACPPRWKLRNWYKIWASSQHIIRCRISGPVNLPGNTHVAQKEISGNRESLRSLIMKKVRQRTTGR